MSLAQVEFYLSGGAANADPDLSLGGAVSATRLKSQTITQQSSNITGLTFDDAVGAEGIGTLKYTNATNSLRWTEFGAIENALNDVDITGDGRHEVRGVAEFAGIFIDVVNASLPAIDAQDDLDIADISNNLFPDASVDDAKQGINTYRMIFMKGLADVGVLPLLFFGGLPGYISILVMGVLTTDAVLETNDSVIPEGIANRTFFNDASSQLPVDLLVGEYAAIWVELAIPAESPYSLNAGTVIGVL